MNRREFITLVGGAGVAWPLAARAQQPAMPVIGFLGSESASLWANYVRAFQQGLREVGYIEGRNVAIEYRWAEGQNERMPGLLGDFLRRPVSVIAVLRQYTCGVGGKGCEHDSPNRVRHRHRPGSDRTRRQSQPTRRQPYGRSHVERRVGAKAPRTAA
jgi:putative tryptophan/tyrosine transport system substrate-binding protein